MYWVQVSCHFLLLSVCHTYHLLMQRRDKLSVVVFCCNRSRIHHTETVRFVFWLIKLLEVKGRKHLCLLHIAHVIKLIVEMHSVFIQYKILTKSIMQLPGAQQLQFGSLVGDVWLVEVTRSTSQSHLCHLETAYRIFILQTGRYYGCSVKPIASHTLSWNVIPEQAKEIPWKRDQTV